MSETTDGVVAALASGYRETGLGVFDDALEAATTTIYPMLGDPSFVELEDDYSDDSEEIKSLPGATEVYHRKTRGKLSRSMRFAAEPFLDFLTWGTGQDSASSASSSANEQFTVTQTGVTAGAFKVRDTLDGGTSAEILYSDNAATRLSKLEAVFGTGNVGVTFSSSVMTVTFQGAYAATNYPAIEVIVTQVPVGGVFALAYVTEGQAAGQYTHTVREPSICQLNPHSFPYAEGLRCSGNVDAYKVYPGCVLASLGFDVDGDDFLKMAVELMTCGLELSKPTFSFGSNDSPMTRLMGNMVTVWIGDAFNSTYLVAPDELAKLSVKWNFNPQIPARINNLKTVSEFQLPKGGMTLDVSAVFKGGKGSRFYGMGDACRDGYRPKMRIRIDPLSTPQRPVVIDFNKLKVGTAVKPAGREQQTDMAIMPLSNATDVGRFTAQVVSSRAAYLQTA